MTELNFYTWRGARAMVLLHERHMREFLATWRAFAASEVALPVTEDPAYASPQALLWHVMRAARGYMTWMCEKLGLPDPEIQEVPPVEEIESRVGAYLEHVLERWRVPLAELAEARSEEEFKSRWGTTYCIDGMLEHAVMHPIRHGFQLQELMKQ